MIEEFDKILNNYETSLATKKYQLTRDEFLCLHFFSKGKTSYEIEDYLDRKKSYVYCIRNQLIVKFKATHFEQVMFIYGQLI